MTGKILKGPNVSSIVNYVNNNSKASLIASEGVETKTNRTIINDMKWVISQRTKQGLAPVKNPVFHIILSFAPEDLPRLSNDMMAEIAKKYLERMGIANTPYIVARHFDTKHGHLHIAGSRICYDMELISDSCDYKRNCKVCRALTKEYGLFISPGKRNVNIDKLYGKDKAKYQIYTALKNSLKNCRSWEQLEKRLNKQEIGVRFHLSKAQNRICGISFFKNGYSFSGNSIDKSMSYGKINQILQETLCERGQDRYVINKEQHDSYLQQKSNSTHNQRLAYNKLIENNMETEMPLLTNSFPFYSDDSNRNNFIEPPTGIIEEITMASISSFIQLVLPETQSGLSIGGGNSESQKGWNNKKKEQEENISSLKRGINNKAKRR